MELDSLLMSDRQSLLKINCLLFLPSRPLFFFLLASLFLFPACGHVVQDEVRPALIPGSTYSIIGTPDGDKYPAPQWWQVFNDPLLDGYIQTSLHENFSLQEGYARLKQARSYKSQSDAPLSPSLHGRISAETTWESGAERDNSSGFGLELAWEVDLWGKLSSAAKAAALEVQAAEDELFGMALLLSTEVADSYYRLVEESLYRELLEKQIAANETTLGLIKLRFINGAASLIDVYQQQDLLASVRAQLPLSKARNVTQRNRLHVLLGRVPEDGSLPLAQALPEIPPLPHLGIPADLLQNRPDLRQLKQELAAADYRVAEAVADRLPGIKIGSAAGFVSGDFLLSVFADALATIVDWGGKKSEVGRRKAVVEEKAAHYSQRYLLAIEEVENALWQERQHGQLLAALGEQLLISRATLRESRNRYIQGLTDYLPVLAALVSLQDLERTILQRQLELVSYRLRLYRALGGNVLLNKEKLLTLEQ